MKPGGSSHHAGALIGSVNWQRGGAGADLFAGLCPPPGCSGRLQVLGGGFVPQV